MTRPERYCDLMRQGITKIRRASNKTPLEIVACDDCKNWHPKGKHTSSPEIRRARRAAQMKGTP